MPHKVPGVAPARVVEGRLPPLLFGSVSFSYHATSFTVSVGSRLVSLALEHLDKSHLVQSIPARCLAIATRVVGPEMERTIVHQKTKKRYHILTHLFRTRVPCEATATCAPETG
jgi:hypothetical protein